LIFFPTIFPEEIVIAGFDTRKEQFINSKKINSFFGTKNIFAIKQVHSTKVVPISQSDTPSKFSLIEGDAMITSRKGILLVIRVADCVPVLLFDANMMCIAAVHCGWRGISGGIIKKTIKELGSIFKSSPENIYSAIGPSIGPCCYEIGSDVAKILENSCQATHVITSRNEKLFADLKEIVKIQLIQEGVIPDNIETIPLCTRCNPHLFYSYRRGDEKLRQSGFIGLVDK